MLLIICGVSCCRGGGRRGYIRKVEAGLFIFANQPRRSLHIMYVFCVHMKEEGLLHIYSRELDKGEITLRFHLGQSMTVHFLSSISFLFSLSFFLPSPPGTHQSFSI